LSELPPQHPEWRLHLLFELARMTIVFLGGEIAQCAPISLYAEEKLSTTGVPEQ